MTPGIHTYAGEPAGVFCKAVVTERLCPDDATADRLPHDKVFAIEQRYPCSSAGLPWTVP